MSGQDDPHHNGPVIVVKEKKKKSEKKDKEDASQLDKTKREGEILDDIAEESKGSDSESEKKK